MGNRKFARSRDGTQADRRSGNYRWSRRKSAPSACNSDNRTSGLSGLAGRDCLTGHRIRPALLKRAPIRRPSPEAPHPGIHVRITRAQAARGFAHKAHLHIRAAEAVADPPLAPCKGAMRRQYVCATRPQEGGRAPKPKSPLRSVRGRSHFAAIRTFSASQPASAPRWRYVAI